jgi:hypothetical protein
MVIGDDNMKDLEKVAACFEKDKKKIFTSKEIEKKSKIDAKKVRTLLTKLLKQGKIERVSRGKYRFSEPKKPPSKDSIKRYLKTLEKTCEIAIHELMLTESLVGKEDREEIVYQIAYFARNLIRVRWELDKGPMESIEIDEEVFSRARKIHDWSKFVFEDSQARKK